MHRLPYQSSPPTHRRGVAMLLVLISVMTATVLTTAYMASRDNSAAIGENVSAAATARWAAESGLDTGLAIMETDKDWRSEHVNGRLTEFSFGDVKVELEAVDLLTGDPPDADTEHVRLTATARVDGLEQIATADLFTPATPANAVDVSLREFAIFADDEILIDNDALVARWAASPISDRKQRVRLGVRNDSSASRVEIKNSDAIVDASVYYGPSASAGVVSASNAPEPHQHELPARVPFPAPPPPPFEEPEDSGGGGLLGSLDGVLADLVDALLDPDNSDDVTIDEDDLDDALGDVYITDGQTVTIQGDVRLAIYGDLVIRNASIELAPGATLTVFVGRDVTMREAYVGDAGASNRTSITGEADAMEPDRIEFFSIDSWDSSTTWRIEQNSIVKASIYAPAANLEIRDSSALYGRVAADDVRLRERSGVFYDHRLDRRRGYTRTDRAESELYTSSGDALYSTYRYLSSLNDSDLQSAADARDAVILPVHRHMSSITPSGGEDEDDEFPWQPTARPHQIEYEITRSGLAREAMESR